MSEGDRATAPVDEWPVDWERQRKEQLTRSLAATPGQRLAWLEEALVLAYRSGALPKRTQED